MSNWINKQIIQVGGGWWWTSFTLSEIEVSVWTSPRKSGKFNISWTGLTIWKPVFIQQANWPYTGKWTLADEAEMDWLVVRWKVTSSTNIECYWTSATKVWKNFKFNYIISA